MLPCSDGSKHTVFVESEIPESRIPREMQHAEPSSTPAQNDEAMEVRENYGHVTQ